MRVGGGVQLLLRGERGWGTFCRKNKDLMAVVEYEDGVERERGSERGDDVVDESRRRSRLVECERSFRGQIIRRLRRRRLLRYRFKSKCNFPPSGGGDVDFGDAAMVMMNVRFSRRCRRRRLGSHPPFPFHLPNRLF